MTRDGCCYQEVAGTNTVANAAWTALTLSGEVRDIRGWGTGLSVSMNGMYLIMASVGFAGFAGGSVGCRVKLDSSSEILCVQQQASNAVSNIASCSTVRYLDRNDSLTVEAYQNSGGGLALLDTYRSQVTISWLSY